MSESPKVSVIMAAYNASEYIEESIQSILNQSFTGFELIVVDDRSTDVTLDCIKKLAIKDPRIRYYCNLTNLAVAKTRNRAIALARGEYLAVQDADDIALPDRLQIQKDFLDSHPQTYMVASGGYIIDAAGKRSKKFIPENNRERLQRRLEQDNCLVHSTVMFRNKGLTYRDKIYYCEDYDLYLTILSHGHQIAAIPQALVGYRVLATSITRTKAGKQWLFSERVKQFYNERKQMGVDRYESFDPKPILSIDQERITDPGFLKNEIRSSLELNDALAIRKHALKYFSSNGFSAQVFLFFVLALTGAWGIRKAKLMKRSLRLKG